MWQFLLGVYVFGYVEMTCLAWIGLAQQKPYWGGARRVAGSLAMGLVWWALLPWLMRRAYSRAVGGNEA